MAGTRKTAKAARKPLPKNQKKHKKVTQKLQRTRTIAETVKAGEQFVAKQNNVKSPTKRSVTAPTQQATPAATPRAATPAKKVEKVVVKKQVKKVGKKPALKRTRTMSETLKTGKSFLNSDKPKVVRKTTIEQTVEASKKVVKGVKSVKTRKSSRSRR